MSYLNAQHYLRIYQTRLSMQEEGITNPSNKIKELTRKIVDELSKLPPDEEIILEGNKMKDSRGNVIAELSHPM